VRETGKTDELAKFLRTQLEEVLNMSDEDILEGANPGALKSENLAMVADAKAEAGRRRMASAKAGIAVKKAAANLAMPTVSLADARAFLEKAMNDTHYTLAARSLGEMSEKDIFRLYNQLHQLKSEDESPDNGNK
jgi:hypothetical protein